MQLYPAKYTLLVSIYPLPSPTLVFCPLKKAPQMCLNGEERRAMFDNRTKQKTKASLKLC
jgi:hypothetical protein